MKFSEQELHASGAASPSGPRTSLIPDALLDLEVRGFHIVRRLEMSANFSHISSLCWRFLGILKA